MSEPRSENEPPGTTCPDCGTHWPDVVFDLTEHRQRWCRGAAQSGSRWCLVHQSDHTTDATSTLCRWVDRAEWDAAEFGSRDGSDV